jgi:hypothetical protein
MQPLRYSFRSPQISAALNERFEFYVKALELRGRRAPPRVPRQQPPQPPVGGRSDSFYALSTGGPRRRPNRIGLPPAA